MKIKNQDIINFINTAANIKHKHLPIKVAYAISVNVAEAESKFVAYEEQRKALLEKHVVKDEEGKMIIDNGSYTVADPDAWSSEIKELLDATAKMNVTTFTIEDLAKCDEPDFDSLTVSELAVLNFMIEK